MFLVFRFLKFLSAKFWFYYHNNRNFKLKEKTMKMWVFTQKIQRFKFGISRLAVTKNILSGRSFSPLPLILSWFLLFRRIKHDIFLFFVFFNP